MLGLNGGAVVAGPHAFIRSLRRVPEKGQHRMQVIPGQNGGERPLPSERTRLAPGMGPGWTLCSDASDNSESTCITCPFVPLPLSGPAARKGSWGEGALAARAGRGPQGLIPVLACGPPGLGTRGPLGDGGQGSSGCPPSSCRNSTWGVSQIGKPTNPRRSRCGGGGGRLGLGFLFAVRWGRERLIKHQEPLRAVRSQGDPQGGLFPMSLHPGCSLAPRAQAGTGRRLAAPCPGRLPDQVCGCPGPGTSIWEHSWGIRRVAQTPNLFSSVRAPGPLFLFDIKIRGVPMVAQG